MNLTDEQKSAVTNWIRDGQSIADAQKRLRSEFGISLTYMETRLLLGDLNLTPKETREPSRPAPESVLTSQPATREGVVGPAAKPGEPSVAGAAGKVRVTIDQIARPDALFSGKVTFSDGETAEWYLDQLGRLALNPTKPGYRPTQQDITAFQTELQHVARTHGY